MANESLILEMFERIKILESDVKELKERILSFETKNYQEDDNSTKIYVKTTPEMIDECYELGKIAFTNPQADLNELADKVVQKTGMNKNSAYMYIYVVKCMLSGEVFKRAVNSNAIKRYFERIYKEYGKFRLADAVKATRMHIDYRRTFGHQVDSLERICDEYSK